jgi:predicted N-acyltransferase
MAYSASIVESLSRFTDAQLQAVTGHGGIFHDWRWLRMCERLDLSEACRGSLSFRFAAVTSGDELVALCPFLVTRSPTILYPYSLEKLYFTGWQDQLLRINPASASWIRYAIFGANAYRRFARRIGAGIEGWVLATSPLSTRGGIVCRDLSAADTQSVFDIVLEAMKTVATEERLPLCFNAISESAPVAEALSRAGCAQVFYVFDHEIALGEGGFDGYLQQFPAKTRRNFRAEARNAEKAGYRFELCRDPEPFKEELAHSYAQTYAKYGDQHFVHPASFWTTLAGSLDGNVETIVARKRDEFAGFVMMLHKGEEMFVFRLGRTASPDGKEPPIYFSLLAWEPIKRALALGVRRLWLASGAWDAKHHRGARGRPFHSYFWFPSARSRLVLKPFVSLFGRINRAQVSRRVGS